MVQEAVKKVLLSAAESSRSAVDPAGLLAGLDAGSLVARAISAGTVGGAKGPPPPSSLPQPQPQPQPQPPQPHGATFDKQGRRLFLPPKDAPTYSPTPLAELPKKTEPTHVPADLARLFSPKPSGPGKRRTATPKLSVGKRPSETVLGDIGDLSDSDEDQSESPHVLGAILMEGAKTGVLGRVDEFQQEVIKNKAKMKSKKRRGRGEEGREQEGTVEKEERDVKKARCDDKSQTISCNKVSSTSDKKGESEEAKRLLMEAEEARRKMREKELELRKLEAKRKVLEDYYRKRSPVVESGRPQEDKRSKRDSTSVKKERKRRRSRSPSKLRRRSTSRKQEALENKEDREEERRAKVVVDVGKDGKDVSSQAEPEPQASEDVLAPKNKLSKYLDLISPEVRKKSDVEIVLGTCRQARKEDENDEKLSDKTSEKNSGEKSPAREDKTVPAAAGDALHDEDDENLPDTVKSFLDVMGELDRMNELDHGRRKQRRVQASATKSKESKCKTEVKPDKGPDRREKQGESSKRRHSSSSPSKDCHHHHRHHHRRHHRHSHRHADEKADEAKSNPKEAKKHSDTALHKHSSKRAERGDRKAVKDEEEDLEKKRAEEEVTRREEEEIRRILAEEGNLCGDHLSSPLPDFTAELDELPDELEEEVVAGDRHLVEEEEEDNDDDDDVFGEDDAELRRIFDEFKPPAMKKSASGGDPSQNKARRLEEEEKEKEADPDADVAAAAQAKRKRVAHARAGLSAREDATSVSTSASASAIARRHAKLSPSQVCDIQTLKRFCQQSIRLSRRLSNGENSMYLMYKISPSP